MEEGQLETSVAVTPVKAVADPARSHDWICPALVGWRTMVARQIAYADALKILAVGHGKLPLTVDKLLGYERSSAAAGGGPLAFGYESPLRGCRPDAFGRSSLCVGDGWSLACRVAAVPVTFCEASVFRQACCVAGPR